MDDTDIKIVTCLLNDCRMPDRQVGLRVGLSGGVVKSRIQKLESAGVIRDYVLKIEPPALGRGVFFVAVSGRNANLIIEQIRLVGDPFVVAPCVGGITVCGIAVTGDVQEKIRLARELMRDVRLLSIFEASPPAQRSQITRTDLAIIRGLMADPRMPAEVLATTAGFSTKTIARSIEKLRQNNAAQFTITYDPARMHPHIPHVILAGLDDDREETIAALTGALGDRFIQNPIPTPNQVVLFLSSKSIYGMDEITQTVRDTKGVVSADLFIPKSIMLPQDWTGAAIKEAAESSAYHIPARMKVGV